MGQWAHVSTRMGRSSGEVVEVERWGRPALEVTLDGRTDLVFCDQIHRVEYRDEEVIRADLAASRASIEASREFVSRLDAAAAAHEAAAHEAAPSTTQDWAPWNTQDWAERLEEALKWTRKGGA